jgi:hypothetical protein
MGESEIDAMMQARRQMRALSSAAQGGAESKLDSHSRVRTPNTFTLARRADRARARLSR